MADSSMMVVAVLREVLGELQDLRVEERGHLALVVAEHACISRFLLPYRRLEKVSQRQRHSSDAARDATCDAAATR